MHARFPNTYVSTHVNIRALIMQEKYDQPRWFIWRSLEIIPVYSRPEYYFLGTRLNIFHSGKFNLFLGMNHDERRELPDSCIFLNNCQYFISWYRWDFIKKKKKRLIRKLVTFIELRFYKILTEKPIGLFVKISQRCIIDGINRRIFLYDEIIYNYLQKFNGDLFCICNIIYSKSKFSRSGYRW